jgi:hypothetical protein
MIKIKIKTAEPGPDISCIKETYEICKIFKYGSAEFYVKDGFSQPAISVSWNYGSKILFRTIEIEIIEQGSPGESKRRIFHIEKVLPED